MLVNAFKQREGQRRTRCIRCCVGASAIERLLVGEGDPLVEFVVEGTDAHVAASARAAGIGLNQVLGVGLVRAIHQVKGPPGVATLRVMTEPTRKGKSESCESAFSADGKLRARSGP